MRPSRCATLRGHHAAKVHFHEGRFQSSQRAPSRTPSSAARCGTALAGLSLLVDDAINCHSQWPNLHTEALIVELVTSRWLSVQLPGMSGGNLSLGCSSESCSVL